MRRSIAFLALFLLASSITRAQAGAQTASVTFNVAIAQPSRQQAASKTFTATISQPSKQQTAQITYSATITQPGGITSITVSPSNQTIASGQIQFSAFDQLGNDITPRVIWSSSDPTVATITSGGMATAIGNGTTTITASF